MESEEAERGGRLGARHAWRIACAPRAGSRAELLGGRFAAEKEGDAPLSTSLRAGRFDLSPARSRPRLPGGIDVAVEDGSRFGVSSLAPEPAGAYSGRVDLTREPREFGPCGPQCFGVRFTSTAEKEHGERSLFRQLCEPEGKADLVVDPAARPFVPKDLQVKPRCAGALGWRVNLVATLLTKTDSDTTLFQLPPDLPFSIETVRSGNGFARIDGEVAWRGKAAGVAAPPLDWARRPPAALRV